LSLRARLTAGLLVVAALGMLAVGAITYAEQRSFLRERVDEQVVEAFGPISRALDDRDIGVPSGFPADPAPHVPTGRRGRGPGSPPVLTLPPGTYGQRRDAEGNVLGSHVIDYGEAAPPAPKLPGHVPTDRPITVGSVGGWGLEYRALARPSRELAGTTIVAVPLSPVNQTLDRLLRVEALVIGGTLLVLTLLATLVVRLGLRPLDRFGRTADAVAGGDLSHRVSPATARTEVGRLGIALNAMLDRLEEAFAERERSEDALRRFLADASHELRTPLTSIRGYAELFRLGAARDQAELAKAMRRIEDEAARMGLLVEDLLALARLDELPEAAREPVDVAQLARDAVDDARATAPERTIQLSADGPALTLGDPRQLRQVLGNLLRNALVHTPTATRVEVSVVRDASHVEVAVRDHGLGLPADDPRALFERFWRAETGRERGKAGAGLGLAIVAGIVAVHGGTVRAENADGGGARFVVRLPAGDVA
jgi:two-component system, OmpR family, sensor kinase